MSEENTKAPSLSPYLTVKDAEAAISFYESVFGMECTYRLPEENGKRLMHATLRCGDSILMLSDEFPEFSPHLAPDMERGSPVAMSIRLEKADDVDRLYNLALEYGAKSSWPPEDMFWGDRFCQIYDPFGHRWMLAATKGDG